MKKKYKIIDWYSYGNIVKLFLGDENLEDWTGDDWDDVPYECNAGPVYDEYVKKVLFLVVNPDKYAVCEPADEYYQNSPLSKDNLKNGVHPIISLVKDHDISPESHFWDGDNIFYKMNEIIEVDEKLKYLTIGF